MKMLCKFCLLFIPLFIPLSAQACNDNEYGCTVALCLPTGGGVQQCNSCLDRLRSDLKHGHGFPFCQGVNYGSKIQYEPCAKLYKNYQKDLYDGAVCGRTDDGIMNSAMLRSPTMPGKRKALQYYEDIQNADGTITRFLVR